MTQEQEFDSMTNAQRDEMIAKQASDWLKESSKQYLTDTDWYVSRKAEAGVEIPSEVLTKRAQARIDASN
tara:strand:- start:5 stop:214 length:210 start_codon:yes stop_codon:yes gene_type:complete